MDGVFGLIAAIGALIVLEALALHYGVDSRDTRPETWW